MNFGSGTRDSDRKCRFHRFCQTRYDCKNLAHRILFRYKLQGIFGKFTDYIMLTSVIRTHPSLKSLFADQQLTKLKTKKSQKFVLTRGKKATSEQSLYSNGVVYNFKPVDISSVSLFHQQIKIDQNQCVYQSKFISMEQTYF